MAGTSAASIRDNYLELLLAKYQAARQTETFGGKYELWNVFDASLVQHARRL